MADPPIDRYGAITLPISPTTGKPDESISDPLIDISLQYFQALINHYGGEAWKKVAPGSLPVKTVEANDPEEVEFNERNLPCLFMWRAGGEGSGDSGASAGTDWMAEDVRVMRDKIMVFWVFPPARQAFRGFREQFEAGLSKILHVAVEMGRDPAWIVGDDPDPKAKYYGSVYPRYAGWLSMSMSRWQDKVLTISMPNGAEKRYPAMLVTLDVAEEFKPDLLVHGYHPGGLDQKVYVPGDPLSEPAQLLVDERIIVNP
jgi:hypothetical protein